MNFSIELWIVVQTWWYSSILVRRRRRKKRNAFPQQLFSSFFSRRIRLPMYSLYSNIDIQHTHINDEREIKKKKTKKKKVKVSRANRLLSFFHSFMWASPVRNSVCAREHNLCRFAQHVYLVQVLIFWLTSKMFLLWTHTVFQALPFVYLLRWCCSSTLVLK